ncbi:MAG: 2-C-methyl-D-erythritol 2,4-cyclodiphosphate synthase [Proteobacteria bacterium]|nr:2-C-methyl-D-erythritol 2,4-cyclodiphosphate synthase [Pseudomonadota bacterium]
MLVGQGYDVHALVEGRPLILGGVEIPYKYGLQGHSDADVLLHAIMDALLGALGEGDIGRHFPDSDPNLSGVDSRKLLRKVAALMVERAYEVGNIDSTIIAQQPQMAKYLKGMCVNIASDLGARENQINVKATTTEQLGFEGQGKGIAAHAICLLSKV